MNLNQVLDAISSALSVVKTVANTPGLNVLPYVSTVSNAIDVLQTAYAAGKNILPYVEAIKNTFSGDLPTQAELDGLDAKIKELEAEVDEPLPPKEDGEPD